MSEYLQPTPQNIILSSFMYEFKMHSIDLAPTFSFR